MPLLLGRAAGCVPHRLAASIFGEEEVRVYSSKRRRRITEMTSGIAIELQAELSLSSCCAVTEAGRFATPHL